MAPQFKKHSTQIGHQAECHCKTCLKAKAWNAKLNEAGYRKLYRSPESVEKLREFHGKNRFATQAILEHVGLPGPEMYELFNGTRMFLTEKQIKAIATLDTLDVNKLGGKYERSKYGWRLGVLAAQGFNKKWLSKRAGFNVAMTSPAGRSENLFYVSAERWDALDHLWKEIGGRMADPATDVGLTKKLIADAKGRARRDGYHPLSAYENEFDAEPAIVDVSAETIQEDNEALYSAVETRIRAGMNRVEIRDQLHRLYPDVESWELVVARVQRRVRRAA